MSKPNEVPKLLVDVKISNLTERGIKFDYIDNTKPINWSVIEEMLEGNDRTKVILAGAGIESLINDLLSKYFSHSEKLIDKSIKHTGFMGSFSSKAEMCYLLGLISNEEHSEIQKLIKLRNRFAHILEKRSLEIEKDHLNSYTLFKVHFKSDWNKQPCVFHLLFIFLTLKAYLEKAINNCKPVEPLELKPIE